MTKGFCIIMPAYNEAKVIGGVLDKLPKSIKIDNEDIPVTTVVVNDGSSDNTEQEVKKRKHIVLVNHLINSGAGGATRTGLSFARENNFDFAITMDSDGQHAVKDVIKLAKAIYQDEADFIIGSRLKGNKDGMVWYRTFGNVGLNLITFLLFGVLVTDSQSGLKAINKKALNRLNFNSSSYAFCSEMIWIAHKRGLLIKEIPIKAIYSDYSLSKGQSNWNVIPLVRELIKRRIAGVINE